MVWCGHALVELSLIDSWPWPDPRKPGHQVSRSNVALRPDNNPAGPPVSHAAGTYCVDGGQRRNGLETEPDTDFWGFTWVFISHVRISFNKSCTRKFSMVPHKQVLLFSTTVSSNMDKFSMHLSIYLFKLLFVYWFIVLSKGFHSSWMWLYLKTFSFYLCAYMLVPNEIYRESGGE